MPGPAHGKRHTQTTGVRTRHTRLLCPQLRSTIHAAQYAESSPAPRPQEDIFSHFEEEPKRTAGIVSSIPGEKGTGHKTQRFFEKIRDRLRDANRAYASADKNLDRAWSRTVRHIWNTDDNINALKKERQRCQRKRSRYELSFGIGSRVDRRGTRHVHLGRFFFAIL